MSHSHLTKNWSLLNFLRLISVSVFLFYWLWSQYFPLLSFSERVTFGVRILLVCFLWYITYFICVIISFPISASFNFITYFRWFKLLLRNSRCTNVLMGFWRITRSLFSGMLSGSWIWITFLILLSSVVGCFFC